MTTWATIPLKYLLEKPLQRGFSITQKMQSPDGFRVIRTSDIDEYGQLDPADAILTNVPYPREALQGDLLVATDVPGRSLVYYAALHGPCCFSGSIVRVDLDDRMNPHYLQAFLQTAIFRRELRQSNEHTTISMTWLATLPVPVPPIDQQVRIVEQVREYDQHHREMLAKQQQMLSLLGEHRVAKMTANVLGL